MEPPGRVSLTRQRPGDRGSDAALDRLSCEATRGEAAAWHTMTVTERSEVRLCKSKPTFSSIEMKLAAGELLLTI